eukprot:gnl/TRDRNA2_/TRDRNA2_168977_c0_seq1.p1 gnl/TRDRNA2_/TRDRNA2_168977_c0~~gnl/TRDRNA2_/TRDRNA2_168977_c0_seq1.p1  ORF type:complete len:459 (-),score=115.40 gnl/TRDRNA2_/TRDRNA2_168977_c0_seq1:46-1422(-)
MAMVEPGALVLADGPSDVAAHSSDVCYGTDGMTALELLEEHFWPELRRVGASHEAWVAPVSALQAESLNGLPAHLADAAARLAEAERGMQDALDEQARRLEYLELQLEVEKRRQSECRLEAERQEKLVQDLMRERLCGPMRANAPPAHGGPGRPPAGGHPGAAVEQAIRAEYEEREDQLRAELEHSMHEERRRLNASLENLRQENERQEALIKRLMLEAMQRKQQEEASPFFPWAGGQAEPVSPGRGRVLQQDSQGHYESQLNCEEVAQAEADDLQSCSAYWQQEDDRLRIEELTAELQKYKTSFNEEVERLVEFRDNARQYLQLSQRMKQGAEEVNRLKAENEDLMHQSVDDETQIHRLKQQLDGAMRQLRSMAEITHEQEKAFDWLMEKNAVLQKLLKRRQRGGRCHSLPPSAAFLREEALAMMDEREPDRRLRLNEEEIPFLVRAAMMGLDKEDQ